ncbi:MAG: ABC transporter ATP-binding protein [Actinomycetia bacterium]|nr:ABC transporter ATP-binding protein [Actinomycetes bacterium]
MTDPTPRALDVVRRGLYATPELLDGIKLTAFIGLAVAAGQLAAPVVIQLAIDRGGLTTGDVQVNEVVRLVIVGAAAVVGVGVLGLLARFRLVSRAETALMSLRAQVFAHVHRLSLADLSESRTGILIARVTSDVDALARFVDWGLFVWLVRPVVVVAGFGVMAVYSWPLALVALAAFLPSVPLLRWTQARMIRAHSRTRTAVGEVLGAFTEMLDGAEVIRAYGAQATMGARLDEASEVKYRASLRANVYMAGVFVVGDLVSAFMMVAVLVVGIVGREALGVTAGELVAVLLLTTLVQMPLSELGETLAEAQQAIAAWDQILGLLATPIEVVEPAAGVAIPAGPVRVRARGVSFRYRGSGAALTNVDVSIEPGSHVAIVGETGSGKSTFAKLLCRLADPTEGMIEIGGVDLRHADPASRQAVVRFVPQDGFLFDTTVAENISFGRPGATIADVHEAIARLGLGGLIEGLPCGLDSPVGAEGGSLSVGERQLVSFARAAVADPGLLILDEVSSAVDPRIDRQLAVALDRLAADRTVISVVHRLSTAARADRVLVFDGGRIVEDGTHSDLVARGGRYTDLFTAWTTAHGASPV